MPFDPSLLLRQYAALQPLHQLHLPYSNLDLARHQPQLVASLIHHPRLQAYPPARSYSQGFWKILVQRLEQGCREAPEEEELEVLEPIYELYLESMMQPGSEGQAGSSAPGLSYKTFFFPLPVTSSSSIPSPSPTPDVAVTLLESLKTIQAGTTGLRTWGASLRLAELILARPQLLLHDAISSTQRRRCRNVLELGSGVGFLAGVVGVVVHSWAEDGASKAEKKENGQSVEVVNKIQADSCLQDQDDDASINTPGHRAVKAGAVWATDLDANVLDSLQKNTTLNGLQDEVHVERLDWGDSLVSADETVEDVESRSAFEDLVERSQPDLILAADVVYDPSLIPLLVSTLKHLLRHPRLPSSDSGDSSTSREAYIASTVRNPETFLAFLDHAREQGLELDEVDASGCPRVFYGCGEGGKGSGDGEVRIVRMT